MSAVDEAAVLALYNRYNMVLDLGDEDAWVALFAPDGVFRGAFGTFVGHNRLRVFLDERRARLAVAPYGDQQHWTANRSVEIRDDHARGICYLQRVARRRSDDAPIVVGQGVYVDRLARARGRWLFTERVVLTSMGEAATAYRDLWSDT